MEKETSLVAGGEFKETHKIIAQNIAEYEEPPKLLIYDENDELLPLEKRKANLVRFYSKQGFSQPNYKEELQRMVAAEVEKGGGVDSSQRIIKTRSGLPIIVRKANNEAQSQLRPRRRGFSNKPVSPVNRREQAANKRADDGEVSISSLVPAFVAVNPVKQTYIIEGELGMSGGLAYTGVDNFLSVVRIKDGEIKSKAKVWLQEGKYEIVVDELSGYLQASLKDGNGESIGQAKIDLYTLPDSLIKDQKISQIKLDIEPVKVGFKAQVISARSFSSYIVPVKDAFVYIKDLARQIVANKDGEYVDDDIKPGSSFILTAKKEGFWGTNAIVSERNPQIKMYPEKMVNALVNFVSPELGAKRTSVIWGQVILDGKPIQGAEVEVTADAMRTVYFKSYSDTIYLPDKDLNKTDKNGYFAFVGSEEGLMAVRVKINDNYLPAETVFVERGFVASAELGANDYQTASVSVFDPMTSQGGLSAEIGIFGADLSIDMAGASEQVISFPGNHGVMVLESVVEGDEYIKTRLAVKRDAESIDIPMISHDWIDNILNSHNVNFDINKGMVVGFAQDSRGHLILSEALLQDEDLALFYFDEFGKIVESETIPAGGGFILFNVPEGLETITTINDGSVKVLSQLVLSERDSISVLSL